MKLKEEKRRLGDLIRTLEVQTSSYQQEKMMDFIYNEVHAICPTAKVDTDNGNIYITKGEADTYPCVVSHMDTVHALYPKSRVFNYNGTLFAIDYTTMRRVGTGGDDKVGVFVCLEMLRQCDVIKLAFFRDEEVGCVGSGVADMDFFKDVSFALQCDRKGYRDFVNSISATKLFSKEFSKAIKPTLKKWGKRETSGGLTDVYQLAENGIGVCVANMSCGYHDPHTANEYCVVKEVMDTTDFVYELIQTLYVDGERWEIKHDIWSNYRSSYRDYGWDGYGGHGWSRDNAYSSHSRSAKWINGASDPDEYMEGEELCPCCDNDNSNYYDVHEGDYYCYGCQAYHIELATIIEGLDDESDVDLLFPPSAHNSNEEEE